MIKYLQHLWVYIQPSTSAFCLLFQNIKLPYIHLELDNNYFIAKLNVTFARCKYLLRLSNISNYSATTIIVWIVAW